MKALADPVVQKAIGNNLRFASSINSFSVEYSTKTFRMLPFIPIEEEFVSDSSMSGSAAFDVVGSTGRGVRRCLSKISDKDCLWC